MATKARAELVAVLITFEALSSALEVTCDEAFLAYANGVAAAIEKGGEAAAHEACTRMRSDFLEKSLRSIITARTRSALVESSTLEF